MQTIMEELYMGNIGFDSGSYPHDSPFVQAAKRKVDSIEKLSATLNEDEKALFEQYCDAEGEIQGITRYDTYAAALKFGILLMAEIFMSERQEQ